MPISGYFDVPFAASGDLATVPDAVQPDGSVSYTQGYGIDYQEDPAVDPTTALEIERTKMNQLFNDITKAIQNWQQACIPPFITSAMNNGTPFSYSAGNMVYLTGVPYRSVVNANTDTPPSAKWMPVPLATPLFPANNLSDVANPATSRANLAAAKSGANSDITSINVGAGTMAVLGDGGLSVANHTNTAAAPVTGSSVTSTVQTVTPVVTTGAGPTQLQLANDTVINCTNIAGNMGIPVIAAAATSANQLTQLSQFSGGQGLFGWASSPSGVGGARTFRNWGVSNLIPPGGSQTLNYANPFPNGVWLANISIQGAPSTNPQTDAPYYELTSLAQITIHNPDPDSGLVVSFEAIGN